MKFRLSEKGRFMFREATPIKDLNNDWDVTKNKDTKRGKRYTVKSGKQIRQDCPRNFFEDKTK